jgi:hypothetical protein
VLYRFIGSQAMIMVGAGQFTTDVVTLGVPPPPPVLPPYFRTPGPGSCATRFVWVCCLWFAGPAASWVCLTSLGRRSTVMWKFRREVLVG